MRMEVWREKHGFVGGGIYKIVSEEIVSLECAIRTLDLFSSTLGGSVYRLNHTMGEFETPLRCREQAENAFPLPFSNPTLSAGGVKRTNRNQHGRQEEINSLGPFWRESASIT
jgi:hypothetical protein